MIITCPKCSATYQIPDEVPLSEGKKMKCSHCQHVFLFSKGEDVSPMESKVEETNVDAIIDIDPVLPEQEETSRVFADEPASKEDMPQPFLPVAVVEPKRKRPVGIIAAIVSFCVLIALFGLGIVYRDVLFKEFLPSSAPSVARRAPVTATKPRVEVKETAPMPPKKVEPVKTEYVEETPEIVLLPQIQSVRFEKRLDPEPTIRIEGVLKNNTASIMKLPEKVRAVAYSAEGRILFEKEIFLTDSVLPSGLELPFFGSYQPAPEGVQWVDVTF